MGVNGYKEPCLGNKPVGMGYVVYWAKVSSTGQITPLKAGFWGYSGGIIDRENAWAIVRNQIGRLKQAIRLV